MKRDSLDVTQVWRICFPAAYAYAARLGVFVMLGTTPLLRLLRQGDMRYEQMADSAVLRLELAISALWPYVEHLFAVDFFPHLLAAATEILRAADFCLEDSPLIALLAEEVAAAVRNLETVLSVEIAPLAVAAEPENCSL